MKLQLIAVGSLKSLALKELWDTYKKRLLWSLEITEVPASKVGDKFQEAQNILKVLNPQSFLVILDEKGENISTVNFASFIEKHHLLGTKQMSFLIGGADGIEDSLKKKADRMFSFGAQTWPHDFVRILLIEQIYRVQQILNHHPYHRGS
ncbi:MAG: 23S rRNA (pseudouridine(1915)-N(3))-methyltransferase RlmH [Proteobacteria bacterium]|nr:23S rRNA (pseudouridine(1915)-N(3))-methyltransferase RlmH [Pseudomonadota bacterium]